MATKEQKAALEDMGLDADAQKEAQRAADEAAKDENASATGLATTEDQGPEPSDQHRSDHVQLRTQTSGDRPDQLTVSDPRVEPFYGHFVTVTGGPHEGVYGVYVDNRTFKDNGKPDIVLVRERGSSNAILEVAYDDLAPAESRGNAPR